MLDAGADGDVVDAGGDQRGGEVDGLVGGAALPVDRRRRGLDRQAGLEPGVAAGLEESELKFKRHVVPVQPVVEKLEA